MNTSTKQPGADGIAQQIFDIMAHMPRVKSGYRPVHAKGIVCQGTFAPAKEAAALSKAAHFQGNSVPVIIRFSDGAPDPFVPDNLPDAGPRGMAIRFELAGGGKADIVAMSHNGFVVGTPEDFLALQQAVAATNPSKSHPWPVETFLMTHPLALKFVQDNQVKPASFATDAFHSNNSFVFVNKNGVKQPGRYKILPFAGTQYLSDTETKAKSADYLFQDLKTRLATGPVKFRLVVQLPNSRDSTKDSSLVWPDNRKTVEVGTISIESVVADSTGAERNLVFDPTHLTDGIELSDDPLPALRAQVYSLSAAFRQKNWPVEDDKQIP
jgi:catalase